MYLDHYETSLFKKQSMAMARKQTGMF